jgi:hypothetical protein
VAAGLGSNGAVTVFAPRIGMKWAVRV